MRAFENIPSNNHLESLLAEAVSASIEVPTVLALTRHPMSALVGKAGRARQA